MKFSRLIASVLLLGAISTPCFMAKEPQDVLFETLRHLREQHKLLIAKNSEFFGEDAITHAKKVNDLELAILQLESSRGSMETFKANKTKAIIIGAVGGVLIIGGLIYVIKVLYDGHKAVKESAADKKAREDSDAKHNTDMQNLITRLTQARDDLVAAQNNLGVKDGEIENAKTAYETLDSQFQTESGKNKKLKDALVTVKESLRLIKTLQVKKGKNQIETALDSVKNHTEKKESPVETENLEVKKVEVEVKDDAGGEDAGGDDAGDDTGDDGVYDKGDDNA